jgi:phytoene synthase
MAAVYGALLRQMLVEGWAPPRRRVRIGKAHLLYLVARCSVFG